MENDFWQKMSFDGRRPSIGLQYIKPEKNIYDSSPWQWQQTWPQTDGDGGDDDVDGEKEEDVSKASKLSLGARSLRGLQGPEILAVNKGVDWYFDCLFIILIQGDWIVIFGTIKMIISYCSGSSSSS